jgi:CRISPR-associated endonuclease Csn1
MLEDAVQRTYTLGLDIGIASVGAALLGDDLILGLHVRTFDRAETAKEGESLNKIRRDSRLTRRRIYRRAQRLLRLCRLFKLHGLISQAEPAAFTTELSPWELRAHGLDRQLTEKEWAAVLYHIVKHRGFQSNRKSEAKTDEKAGEMLSGVSHNQRLLQESGYRTMGELAARHGDFSGAKRNKGGSYTHTFARADLEDEMRQLFASQRTFENGYVAHEFEQAVHALLMARRPTLSGDNLLKMVGRCTFEPNEFRAPKASYAAERFVWLTKLNNLRLSGMGETRALSDDERATLMQMPFVKIKSRLTYAQVRNALDLPEHERFIGLRYPTGSSDKNPEDGTLFEAKAFHALRKAYEGAGLKLEWARDSQTPERLNTLAYAMTVFKDDDEARDWLIQQGVESVIIETVLNVSFSEFVRLSIKALEKILPHMEAGKRYDEAVQLAGYAHHSQLQTEQKVRYIPRLSKNAIPNPVVYRALNQARKLVNAIVREYGPPIAVHIELARDLSKPFDERRQIEKEQKKYRENKLADIEQFEETFEFTPRGLDLIKWRLYREQNAQCAYSLKSIELERLYEPGYAEVDHALPYSRSFDDGMNNKVLALTVENRDKGNQTPYEYLGGKHESYEWRSFVAMVMANKNYREAKRRNLLRKDFGEEASHEFRERHLTDTRYIAREFKRMVETHLQLNSDNENQRCVVISGQLTGYLRTRWGLIKVRENGDLHHAMDAAVVAACSRSMVKRLSDYSRRGELAQVRGGYVNPETGEVLDLAALRTLEDQFPMPWPHYRHELLAWLSPDPAHELARLDDYSQEMAERVCPVRVSRAPTRRGLGAAHQETIRSAKWLTDNKSAVKVALESLKLKDIPNIVGYGDPRNDTLIESIAQRLREHGDDGKKAFKEPLYKPSAPGKAAPLIRSVRLLDTQKSGLPVRGGIANNGDMLRTDIFTDGKRFYAVPLYVADAVKSELPSRAVVAAKPEAEWTVMDDKHTFLFSLYTNDWVRIVQKGKLPIEGYYSAVSRSTGAMDVWTHDRDRRVGRKGKEGLTEGIGIKTALAVEKYHVDLLGRLHRVHHETRKPLKAGR